MINDRYGYSPSHAGNMLLKQCAEMRKVLEEQLLKPAVKITEDQQAWEVYYGQIAAIRDMDHNELRAAVADLALAKMQQRKQNAEADEDTNPDDAHAQAAEQRAELGTEGQAAAIAASQAQCCCPKIGEKWNPAKHGKDCPVHDAKALANAFDVPTEPLPAVEFIVWRAQLAGIIGAEHANRKNGTAFELFEQGLSPQQAAQRMVDQACANGERFTAQPRTISNCTLWLVYDQSNQRDVFHWYGATGQAKCEAVAAALNALGHGKD